MDFFISYEQQQQDVDSKFLPKGGSESVSESVRDIRRYRAPPEEELKSVLEVGNMSNSSECIMKSSFRDGPKNH